MVVAQVAEQGVPVAPHEPTRASRLPGVAWTTPAQIRRSLPLVRLLAEIWTIPQVLKIGLQSDNLGVHVWVIMPDDDRQAESKITLAERDYLQATTLHMFVLDVVPLTRVREEILPPFEVILER